MKAPRYLLFCMGGFALGMHIAAQDASMPTGWKKFRGDTNQVMSCANHSDDEWRVTMEKSGKLNISHPSKLARPELPPHFTAEANMRGRRVVAKAGDGWLIGFDAGEFGGGLWWANDSGGKKELTRQNVHAIISRGPELLVFTGLNHLTTDEGRIYSYRPAPGRVEEFVEISDLGSAPDAALIDTHGTVLIAAQTRVAALNPSNQLRMLYQNRDMAILHPNSIAEDQSGNLVIGMRFFVLQLQLRSDGNYDPAWYVPDRCSKIFAKIELEGLHCVCR